ncbi:MAG: hypothetical protein ACYDBV_01520 [Nitrospiria bacterium]
MRKPYSKRIGIVFLLFSLVSFLAGNTYACLFPFSMQMEKSLMTCGSSEDISPAVPSQAQTDDNCNQALLEAGKVHHVNSSSPPVSLKTSQTSLFATPLHDLAFSLPETRFLFFPARSKFLPTYTHDVPIYTFTNSLLI